MEPDPRMVSIVGGLGRMGSLLAGVFTDAGTPFTWRTSPTILSTGDPWHKVT